MASIRKKVKQQIIQLFPEYFNKRKHQKMLKFYEQFIKKGDLCFDIGANIGNRTEVFLALDCKVVSIEPQHSCLTILKEKFGGNTNVELVPKAMGSEAGEMEMMIANVSEISSLSKEFVNHFNQFDELKWDGKQMVEISTLDALIEQYGMPKFSKIDVEGYEVEVLKGLSQPLPILSFEFTKPLKKNIATCVELLSNLGEYRYNYSTYESMKMSLPKYQNAEDFLKSCKDIPEEVLHGDIYAILQ